MARIDRAELIMVRLEPEVVRTDAIQAFVAQETPILRLTDADGTVGTGYTYTIGTGGHAVLALLVHDLLPRLVGQNADDIERIWRMLKFVTHATQPGAITALALAAIDTALWDLRGQRTGLPLHRMAGGAQPSVPLYTTEGGWLNLSAEALVDDALRAKETGFGGAKVKIGKTHAAEDVARLAAVREAVGDRFMLFTDANQAFTVGEAARRARLLEPLDIGWLEEPLPADDVAGHVRLAQATTLPVAVGESIYSVGHFGDYMRQGACSVIQVDVGRIGGITPWLKVAHAAEAFNLPVCPHFLMELHVSLACAVPNAAWVEYIPQLRRLTRADMTVRDGRAVPPSAPGLGIAWDWDAVDALTLDGTRHDLRDGQE